MVMGTLPDPPTSPSLSSTSYHLLPPSNPANIGHLISDEFFGKLFSISFCRFVLFVYFSLSSIQELMLQWSYSMLLPPLPR